MSSLQFMSLRCFLLQGIEAKEINLFLFDRFKCYLVVSDGQDSTAAPLFLSREEEVNDKSVCVCVSFQLCTCFISLTGILVRCTQLYHCYTFLLSPC